jgi:hypothetical protein
MSNYEPVLGLQKVGNQFHLHIVVNIPTANETLSFIGDTTVIDPDGTITRRFSYNVIQTSSGPCACNDYRVVDEVPHGSNLDVCGADSVEIIINPPSSSGESQKKTIRTYASHDTKNKI